MKNSKYNSRNRINNSGTTFESAKMKVTYDTKRPGRINKSVTITSNAKATPTKVVRIKGNVTVPAPAN